MWLISSRFPILKRFFINYIVNFLKTFNGSNLENLMLIWLDRNTLYCNIVFVVITLQFVDNGMFGTWFNVQEVNAGILTAGHNAYSLPEGHDGTEGGAHRVDGMHIVKFTHQDETAFPIYNSVNK